jgi:hypothetical protein
MKKIIIALLIAGTGQIAVAQESQVCRKSSDNKAVACYKTKYAENFKICQTNSGYVVCGETPTYKNSTRGGYISASGQVEDMNEYNERYVLKSRTAPDNQQAADVPGAVALLSPEAGSQSYPSNYVADLDKSADFGALTTGSYAGYKPGSACYTGDNVAENNKAPYKGCPSPQDDGPAKNNYRNINVSNPVNLPPLAGRPE